MASLSDMSWKRAVSYCDLLLHAVRIVIDDRDGREEKEEEEEENRDRKYCRRREEGPDAIQPPVMARCAPH